MKQRQIWEQTVGHFPKEGALEKRQVNHGATADQQICKILQLPSPVGRSACKMPECDRKQKWVESE